MDIFFKKIKNPKYLLPTVSDSWEAVWLPPEEERHAYISPINRNQGEQIEKINQFQ